MSPRVVGLDLSLSATGIATASGELVTVRSTPDLDTIAARCERLVQLLGAILEHVQGDDVVVLEGPAYSQQAQAGVHLRAGLWWTVAGALAPTNELIEVSPSALKKFATGRGNATKPDMRMALYQRADLDVRDDNQVDAWWLRQLGLHLLDSPDAIPLPRVNLGALTKVRRP